MSDGGSLAYWEWSVPDGSDIDDLDVVRAANPAFGTRINEEFLAVERANMTDEEYARERLGIFPDEDEAPAWEVVSEEAYEAVCSKETPDKAAEPGWLVGSVAVAVEMSNDRSRTSIAVAGQTREGRLGLTIAAVGSPSWVVDEILTMKADESRPVLRVVIDPRSPAGALIAPLEAVGVTVTECPTGEFVKATGALLDDIDAVAVVIRPTDDLTRAVSQAKKRKAGEATVIDRWGPHDASAFIAIDLARWGFVKPSDEKPPRSGVVV